MLLTRDPLTVQEGPRGSDPSPPEHMGTLPPVSLTGVLKVVVSITFS